ncbi:MAG: VWA domain-containing protein [Holophagaceae bacterium]|nr:VWA domain-containing protein [Holophagaceae bacterium]
MLDYSASAPQASYGVTGGVVGGVVGGTGQIAALARKQIGERIRVPSSPGNTEAYAHQEDNPFLAVTQAPLSTFSIDVDTAAYSNTRRFLREGQLPPKDSVRIEELLNSFTYDYAQPTGSHPFSVITELATCPWEARHRLLRVGLQGKRMDPANRPGVNLVFLVDVSGSMREPNKLPLVKQGLRFLVDQLGDKDRVAITVYAGSAGLALPPTSGSQRERVLACLADLEAGGSTNGAQGIQQAYQVAESMQRPGAMTRVILATDGDFNVGVSSEGELVRLIEGERKKGIFLTVLGFGMGNLKDSTLEKLADKGNGHYAYIDRPAEARKVLGTEAGATLFTIAKDVKLQLEFNPVKVGAYRLIGYENRLLRDEDFNDDAKDAGDMGAGHSVTALYELVPPGERVSGVDALKYQTPTAPSSQAHNGELLTVKVRYKTPQGETSQLLSHTVADMAVVPPKGDFSFAAGLAAFGMMLRESPYKGKTDWSLAAQLVQSGLGSDPSGQRHEALELISQAQRVAHSKVSVALRR